MGVIVDFARIETGEEFEEMCEDLFIAMGFDDPPPERSGRGPDAGRDFIVTEKRQSPARAASVVFRWLVQCKHKAHSGRAVYESEVGSIVDKMTLHNVDGYWLVTSTRPSTNLERVIRKIDEEKGREATFWDRNRLARELMNHPDVYEKHLGPTPQKEMQASFAGAFEEWKEHGIYVGKERLDWFYDNREYLRLGAEELMFVLVSEFRHAQKAVGLLSMVGTYRPHSERWVALVDSATASKVLARVLDGYQSGEYPDGFFRFTIADISSVHPVVARKRLSEVVEGYQTGKYAKEIVESFVSSARHSPDLSLQGELLTMLRENEGQPLGEIIRLAYTTIGGHFQYDLQDYIQENVVEFLCEVCISEESEFVRAVIFDRLFNYWQAIGVRLPFLRFVIPDAFWRHETVRKLAFSRLMGKKYYTLRDIRLLAFLDHRDADRLLLDAFKDFCQRQRPWRLRYRKKPGRSDIRRIAGILGDHKVKEAVPWLIECLPDENQELRLQCIDSLAMIGDPSAIEALVERLSDRSESIRRRAAKALLTFKDSGVVPAVLESLGKENITTPDRRGVRRRKVQVLRQLGDPLALPLLRRLESADCDSSVRKAANKAIRGIGKQASAKSVSG